MRDVPLVITGLLNTVNVANQETKSFVNVDGIMGMENLPMLKPDQLSQIFKAYKNGLPDTMFSLVIANQDGLALLLLWAMYSKRRGRALYLTKFAADVMIKILASFEDYLRNKDNASSLKLPRYQGKCDFEELCLRFQAFMSTQMGVRYTGLGYVISPDMGATYDPANDA